MIEVDQFGTFDVENYGDLLYPVVFRHLLENFDPRFTLRLYSLMGGSAPQFAGYETCPTATLFETSGIPRRVVIGGGDLLRTDSEVVAGHYSNVQFARRVKFRRSLGTTGQIQYLIRKALSYQNAQTFFTDRFRKLHMNYQAAGPFIVNRQSLSKGSRVYYLSCGVPHEFSASETDEVRQAFEGAEFIYLRDEYSVEKLRRAGIEQKIHVAPDLIVMLSELFERPKEIRKGRQILSKFGVDPGRRILCFQSQPCADPGAAEIVRGLLDYRERSGAEVVLLPLGYCHQDYEFLKGISRRSEGILKLVDVHSIYECLSVIAASNIFVGTSLHGNITAFSFGIPIVYGPLLHSKADGFLKVADLPDEIKLRSWKEMNEKIDMVNELGENFFLRKAQDAKSKVRLVVNELMQRLHSAG